MKPSNNKHFSCINLEKEEKSMIQLQYMKWSATFLYFKRNWFKENKIRLVTADCLQHKTTEFTD